MPRVVFVAVLTLASSSTALAQSGGPFVEQGTVQLRDGSVIRGGILTHDASGVVVQLEDGQRLTFPAESVIAVELDQDVGAGAEGPPVPVIDHSRAGGVPVGPGPVAPSPSLPALRGRPPTLAPPLILMAVGAGVTALGAGVFTWSECIFDCEGDFTTGEMAGIAIMAVGGAFFAANLLIHLPIRIAKRRRWRRRLAVLPAFDRQTASLLVAGRFD